MKLAPLLTLPSALHRLAAAWDARRGESWLLVHAPGVAGPRTLGLWRGAADGRFEPSLRSLDRR